MFTGRDGVKVTTTQAITIPAADPTANPPQYVGVATISAQALLAGAAGNIAPEDIDTTYSNGVSVKNTNPFQYGRDARDYTAVVKRDLSSLTTTVKQTVTQAFTTAFIVRQGEEAIPTTCHTTATPDHQIGDEARSVTLTIVKTCSAVAYNRQQLDRLATAAFTQTRPTATYHMVGSVQTTLQSVSPFIVALSGKWAYTFSQDYEQLLAQGIQGESPAKANAYLLKTGVISYASIPATLPSAEYITFLVLVG